MSSCLHPWGYALLGCLLGSRGDGLHRLWLVHTQPSLTLQEVLSNVDVKYCLTHKSPFSK